MKTGWALTDNPFENSTRGSHMKMLHLGQFTLSALKSQISDPFFLNLYDYLKPFEQNYKAAYNHWQGNKGDKKGKTLGLNQLLKKLSNPVISDWQVKVMIHYGKNTGRYTALFPKGTKPFHNGSKAERLNAVGVLSQTIGTDTNLAALKTEVDAYHEMLINAQAGQSRENGALAGKSNEVEKLRKELAIALMVIYGNLVVLYAERLESIDHYFDLENLRDKRQKSFTRTIKPGLSKTIIKRTFKLTQSLKIHNTGHTDLLFCVRLSKGMVCETGFIVKAGQTKINTAPLLGNLETEKYLTTTNNGTEVGNCVVTLL